MSGFITSIMAHYQKLSDRLTDLGEHWKPTTIMHEISNNMEKPHLILKRVFESQNAGLDVLAHHNLLSYSFEHYFLYGKGRRFHKELDDKTVKLLRDKAAANLARYENRLDKEVKDLPIYEDTDQLKAHRSKERVKEVVVNTKKQFLALHGRMYCECCLYEYSRIYEADIYEVHHKVPPKLHGENQPVLAEELAIICPNCHTAIHKLNCSVEKLRNQITSRKWTQI